jgi:hypothetical protein
MIKTIRFKEPYKIDRHIVKNCPSTKSEMCEHIEFTWPQTTNKYTHHYIIESSTDGFKDFKFISTKGDKLTYIAFDTSVERQLSCMLELVRMMGDYGIKWSVE